MPPDKPRVIGPAIADAMTGFYAAFGMLAALYERQTTGAGRRIDVSMLEAMCHFNLDSFTHYFSEGEIMGPLSRPMVSQSYVFECADRKWLALHMSSPPKFWEGLASVIASAGSLRRSALCNARSAHRASGRPDRADGADLQATDARGMVRRACRSRGPAFAGLRFRRGARGPAGQSPSAQSFGRAPRDGHLHHGPQPPLFRWRAAARPLCRRRLSASTMTRSALSLRSAVMPPRRSHNVQNRPFSGRMAHS